MLGSDSTHEYGGGNVSRRKSEGVRSLASRSPMVKAPKPGPKNTFGHFASTDDRRRPERRRSPSISPVFTGGFSLSRLRD